MYFHLMYHVLMYLLPKFCGHRPYESEDVTLYICYMDILEKSELTALIYHIEQIFKIRNAVSTVFEKIYVKCHSRQEFSNLI